MAKKQKNREVVLPHPSTPVGGEIKGIVFILIAVLLGVSLCTYHPGDPSLFGSTARTARVHNLFGTVGAYLADGIFFLLGFSSFWLVAAFLALAVLSFRRERFTSPGKNIFFFLLMVVSFSGLVNLQFPDPVPYRGVKVVTGGLLGIHIAGFMKGFLNIFGSYVLLLAVFIISLMVCTRISFGWIFSGIATSVALSAQKLREYTAKRRERKRKRIVRITRMEMEKAKPKREMTIKQPHEEPPKRPEQEIFPFMNVAGSFKLPPLDLLDDPPAEKEKGLQRESLQMNARLLEKKLLDFGVEGEVVEILPGPVITMYEFKPAPGVKISKVAGLSDDLALALRAQSIRIVAPIPGKAAIGIEIPNNERETVYLKEILSSTTYKNAGYRLTIALGKDITGAPVVTDLGRMPHLLVAGATGTGKSISLNAMINSILFKSSPEMIRFLMIDPKRIELSVYKDIPHLLHPVVTRPKEATKVLRWAVEEMERRYMLLSEKGVRNIDAYNRKLMKEKTPESPNPLPYIILVIDELADLMMTSSREVEETITRLAQMARAAGMHLIIATQRPSVDVLTGIIKANFPARISFQVSSRVDSRTILDGMGAESLLGEGDMLFMPPGVGKLMRIHGAFISEEEVKRVADFLRDQMSPDYDPDIMEEVSREEGAEEDDIEMDEKYDRAVDLVIQTGQASISMIQRKLRVGYNRAARMIELMERQGIVGPSDGVKAREVIGRR